MPNELINGEPRLGWFVDGNPDTDHVAVMLLNTGTTIELTVPLKELAGDEDPYGRWWSSGINYGDDPGRTKYSYQPPRVLLMQDAQGPVVLVGCRSGGFRTNFLVGTGKITVNYAVLGGTNLHYGKINGLSSNIPALAAWTRLSSEHVEVERNAANRSKSVNMQLTDAGPIALARPLNLKMRPNWAIEQAAGTFIASEQVELETYVSRPRSWAEHLQFHGAVLDLVSIAAWMPFGFSSIKVSRVDDPERTLAGTAVGTRWLDVVTHRLAVHQPWKKEPRFLFPFSEIGPRGIARWITLRKTYGRVFEPLMTILRSETPWSHSSVVQSGIALEHLGYLIDVEKNGGTNLDNRRQISFNNALRVILDDMETKPFPDHEAWIRRANATYMGAKHPDRVEPDSLEMLNSLRENLLILRFWIGLQLGLAPKTLREAFRSDRLANEFRLVE